MWVVKYRKIWFSISTVIIIFSIWSIFNYGFNLSIDFKGGTLTEVYFSETRPEKSKLEEQIMLVNVGGFSLRPSGDNAFVIRTKELNELEKKNINDILISEFSGKIERQNTVGPIAGNELKSKATKAVAVVILMIVLFITFAFRKVSKPVSSWKYGLATIIALSHDVIIPTGIFAFLGMFIGIEIDLLFVTGLLAILGYSVHDTIVVFDRVRENLKYNQEKDIKESFETTVGRSVSQTFTRSINTSVTIFITLIALYVFGSIATKNFSLLLLIGVVAGTYSSIFIASPLLITFYKWQKSSS